MRLFASHNQLNPQVVLEMLAGTRKTTTTTTTTTTDELIRVEINQFQFT